jgi:SM-20-related protein
MAVLTDKEQKFETLIDGIVNQGFGLCDHFINSAFADELKNQLLAKFDANKFSQAGVGQGAQQKQHLEIRSDSILWIENDSSDQAERKYLDFVNEFMQYMNMTCFTALKDFELHYACYPAGSFYRKHVDSFVNDKSRQYSLIVYLNSDWTDADGGQLKLYLEDKIVEILPISGRAVCFPSHLIPHEVLNSNKKRLSLTGWFKK